MCKEFVLRVGTLIGVAALALPLCVAGQGQEQDLAELNKQLNNPLASVWGLQFQNNTSLMSGDIIASTEVQNVINFQPLLPVPVGSWTLITRPVIPFVTLPNLDAATLPDVDGHTTGLGDIALVTFAGPPLSGGWVFGFGPTFILPTATDDRLGQHKWQAGPAVVGLKMSQQWVIGGLLQQWWSFAGSDAYEATSQMNLQYFITRLLPNAWQIGMTPNITVNWKADDGNKLTLPVGLGVGKTTRIGKLPTKLLFEVQYSLIRPDDYGQQWNFRFAITPVIPSPF